MTRRDLARRKSKRRESEDFGLIELERDVFTSIPSLLNYGERCREQRERERGRGREGQLAEVFSARNSNHENFGVFMGLV